MSAATNLAPSPEITEAPAPIAVPPAIEFRSRMGSIGRQSAVYFAGTILTTAAGYFFRVYLARTLGAEGLGLYALGMSMVGFLALFGVMGLPMAASRFVAEYSAKRDYLRLGGLLRRSLTVLAIANIILAAVLLFVGPWVAVHFYHAPALRPYFWSFALIMVFGSLTAFFGQAMAGYLDVSRRTLITHFFGTPTNMLLAVVLVSVGFGLAGYLAAQVASGFLVALLLAVYVWKSTPSEARRAGWSAKLERKVASFSAAALSLAAVEFVMAQADKIVLGYCLSAREVGIYSVAIALTAFVPVALQSVNQIFSPTIAELYASGNHALLHQLYSSLTKWVLALSLPLALTIVFLARPLLAIFGKAFEAGVAVLIIGTAGQLINCGVGSVGYLLLMSGHQRQMVKIQTSNAAIMIATSIVLVPRFGIIGAALASTISLVITNVWALAAVFRTLSLFPYDRSYLKLALPCLFSALALELLRLQEGAHSAWVLAAVALGCAYIAFFTSFILFGLDSTDRTLVRVVWNKITLNSQKIGVNFG